MLTHVAEQMMALGTGRVRKRAAAWLAALATELLMSQWVAQRLHLTGVRTL